MKRLIALLVASAALLAPAHSATFKPIAAGHSLVMTGDVIYGDAERLTAAYHASAAEYGFYPERIFLNSPGGNVIASAEVADVVTANGMHTVVGRKDKCISACVIIFAAGSHRVAFPTSQIAVHSASTPMHMSDGTTTWQEDDTAQALTLRVARALIKFDAPDSVVVKVINTPSDTLTYLTWEDVSNWVEIIE